ncbi:MAG: DUF58 domain-containing protein [Chloroflexi bacterium]|nr:DUF58 domain-containing protein [Chloroflexota bacterium]
MNKTLLRLTQAYILLVLLAAAVIPAPPNPLLALVLLLVMLFISLRPLAPGLKLAITVSFVFLMPPVVARALSYLVPASPAALTVAAAVSVLPALYLVDASLRQHTQTMKAEGGEKAGRFTSRTFMSLIVSALAVLLAAFVLGNRALLFTAVVFALYLGGIWLGLFLAIPTRPFAVETVWRRVIAGGGVDVPQYLTSRAKTELQARISPVESWVGVIPNSFVINKSQRVEFTCNLNPPLSGPSHPELRISALDPRGFIRVTQVIRPVALGVIPRARYAEWLASRYLEQAKAGGLEATGLPPRAVIIPRRGIEYHDSRRYQAGDHLRDIDWKHTIKLNQLIVKEYVDAGKQAAILGVNLSVADAEAADKLAFSLVTAALTLAREGVPTALAAYNEQRVVLTVAFTDPREILKQTLSLVKEIRLVEFPRRYLEPPDFGKLGRNMAQLKRVASEPAQRLLKILDFEYQAMQSAAKGHPAMVALSLLSERTPAATIIVLVSQLNHDAEAIQVAAEKLARREFTIIPVGASG